MASRPMVCMACGSGHTEALGGTFCCLDCGAQSNFLGEVVRDPKTEEQRGGPDGEPMDAAAGQSADFYAGRTSDFPAAFYREQVAATTKKGKK